MQLVTKMIEGAVNSGATDIHLIRKNRRCARYRIDGVLHDVSEHRSQIEAAWYRGSDHGRHGYHGDAAAAGRTHHV